MYVNLQHMKIIWLNFHDIVPNNSLEIEFSFEKSHFFNFNLLQKIQMVYSILKPWEYQVNISICKEAKIIVDFSKLSILHHENE